MKITKNGAKQTRIRFRIEIPVNCLAYRLSCQFPTLYSLLLITIRVKILTKQNTKNAINHQILCVQTKH